MKNLISLQSIGLLIAGLIGAAAAGALVAVILRWIWAPMIFFVLGNTYSIGTTEFYDFDQNTAAMAIAVVLPALILAINSLVKIVGGNLLAGIGFAGATIGVLVGIGWFSETNDKPNDYDAMAVYTEEVIAGNETLVIEQLTDREQDRIALRIALEGLFSENRLENFYDAAVENKLINPTCVYYALSLEIDNNSENFDAAGLDFVEARGAKFFDSERSFNENCKSKQYSYQWHWGWMVKRALESEPVSSDNLKALWRRNIFLTSWNGIRDARDTKKIHLEAADYGRDNDAVDNANWALRIIEKLNNEDLDEKGRVRVQEEILSGWE